MSPEHHRTSATFTAGTPGSIFDLVRARRARSRADIARLTGLSATTVAARVDELIRAGYLREAGPGVSRGGRRPRSLEVDPGPGYVASVDLGTHHATFGLFDLVGSAPLAHRHLPLDIADGPAAVMALVLKNVRAMIKEAAHPKEPLRGIGVGLPGPVDSRTGLVVSPSRMPGWNGVDCAKILQELSGVPVIVDNDANLMAFGEEVATTDDSAQMVFLKAGSSIGCGIIANGMLHHGFRGMAGDISHAPVADGPNVMCSCGRSGCLDTVAGGAAIVAEIQADGVNISDTQDLLRLANDAHPLATQLLRQSGTRTGTVLATIVNFFNPKYLILGGHLSETEAFVAGVRSAIYTQCLPMSTDGLEIRVSEGGPLGGIIGGARLIRDHIFAPDLVDATLVGDKGSPPSTT